MASTDDPDGRDAYRSGNPSETICVSQLLMDHEWFMTTLGSSSSCFSKHDEGSSDS